MRRAAALAALSREAAATAADQLVQAGIFMDAVPVDFAHPLVRSVVAACGAATLSPPPNCAWPPSPRMVPSNAEIAQQLVVTRRTVETHLTSAYRKLAIKRRDDLEAALAPDS